MSELHRDGGEIRALTGLRGVAAVLVAIFHFKLNDAFFQFDHVPSLAVRSLGRVLDRGYIWVDLFFVLSGFVLAMSYAEKFQRGFEWQNYRLFLSRRLARIYPLYLITTLGTALLFALHSPPPSLGRTLCLNIALVQAWGFAPTLNAPGWSISTEWAAYLVFPLLVALVVSGSGRLALLTGAVCVGALGVIAALPTAFVFGRVGLLDAHDSSNPLPLIRCLAEFCLGLLCFRTACELRLGPKSSAHVALGAAGVILVLCALPDTDVAIVGAFTLLILGLAGQHGVVAGLISHPVVHGLGVLSYSFYLLHFRFIWLERALRDRLSPSFGHEGGQAIALIVVFALLLGCSAMSYAFIEKPARVWLRTAPDLWIWRRRSA